VVYSEWRTPARLPCGPVSASQSSWISQNFLTASQAPREKQSTTTADSRLQGPLQGGIPHLLNPLVSTEGPSIGPREALALCIRHGHGLSVVCCSGGGFGLSEQVFGAIEGGGGGDDASRSEDRPGAKPLARALSRAILINVGILTKSASSESRQRVTNGPRRK